MWKKVKPYVISIAIALGVGGLSAFLTRKSMDVYMTIKQPLLAPPPIWFPIVWSILFVLMGVGSALVYKKEKSTKSGEALRIYSFQLIVNFFWSIIFFNLRAYFFAFVWLVLLWCLVVWMILKFKKISFAAAYLQIPYLVWITFAGYLNLMIFILNR